MNTLAKSENSNEMPQNVAFHQDLHRLLRHEISSENGIYFCLEIITCDPLMYTMDLPKFIVSNQKEDCIREHKGLKCQWLLNCVYCQDQLWYLILTVHKIA